MINALLHYVSLVCLYASLVCAAVAAITSEIVIADRLLSDGALQQIAEVQR